MDFMLESSLIVTLLVGFYRLFLYRFINFTFSRVYLLLCVILSVVIPFIHFPVEFAPKLAEQVDFTMSNLLLGVTVYPANAKSSLYLMLHSFSFYHIVYVGGMIFLLARMYIAMMELSFMSEHITYRSKDGHEIIDLPGNMEAFSFFHFIFIKRANFTEDQIATIYRHEKAHARLGHSFDVVLVEIFLLFHWFNPFVWLLKRMLCQVHEFQADREVLSDGFSRGRYKELLLQQISGGLLLPVSPFGQSLTKKRFMMMNFTQKLSGFDWFKVLASSCPFLAVVVLVFTLEETSVQSPTEIVVGEGSRASNIEDFASVSGVVLDENGKMTQSHKVYFLVDETITDIIGDNRKVSGTSSSVYAPVQSNVMENIVEILN